MIQPCTEPEDGYAGPPLWTSLLTPLALLIGAAAIVVAIVLTDDGLAPASTSGPGLAALASSARSLSTAAEDLSTAAERLSDAASDQDAAVADAPQAATTLREALDGYAASTPGASTSASRHVDLHYWYEHVCALETGRSITCWKGGSAEEVWTPPFVSPWKDNAELLKLELSGIEFSFDSETLTYALPVESSVSSTTDHGHGRGDQHPGDRCDLDRRRRRLD